MSAKLPTNSKEDVQFVQAIQIRKKQLMLLQGKVCRVHKWQTSTSGKHGGAKIHFFGYDVFTGKKVEEIFNSHDQVTMPDSEKFVITVRKIKEGGVLDAKFEGKPVSTMKIPAAGQLREDITRALKQSGECQVECMATYGMRGCCSVLGVTAASKGDSNDEQNESASASDSADAAASHDEQEEEELAGSEASDLKSDGDDE